MREEFSGDHLIFIQTNGGRLQISSSVLATICSYIQNTDGKDEAGGMLLGRHILGTNDIIVDCVTEPMEGDRRCRSKFFRAREPHQETIDHAWRESGGICTYLGEWHTHPERYPRPSLLDWLDWMRRLLVDQFTEPIFFVIIGMIDTCVWEGQRNYRLKQLSKV